MSGSQPGLADGSGRVTTCFACGMPLAGLLERLGSLRCDACRDCGARLDPALVGLQIDDRPPQNAGAGE